MKFAIVSTIAAVPMSALREYAAAQTRQIAEDFADLWQSGPIPVEAFATVADAGSDWTPIVIYQDADQPGELGDHETTPDGRPVGRVFAGPVFANGGDVLRGANALTTTLSHEVLETDDDPYINAWYDTPDGDEEAAEVGDRVEADWYEIDRVAMTNFLGPRAFSLAGPGPYDRLGNLKNAWDMTPGGYKNRRAGGPAGTITQVFGEKMPEWKRALKRTTARFRRRLSAAQHAKLFGGNGGSTGAVGWWECATCRAKNLPKHGDCHACGSAK